MVAYTREDGAIVQEYEIPETGSHILFRVRDPRKERTGIHGTVAIMHGDILLSWSRLNVERDEDRTRLANSAHRNLPPLDRNAWPNGHLKHALDLFCAGLWQQHVRDIAGELMEGDPDIGPPKQIVGPFIIQGGGTIIYAPPGRGKSYIALLMAVSLDASCDKVWPVRESRRTVYINMERSRDSMRHRLARVNLALGLDSRRPLTFVNARGRSLADIADGLRYTIKEHGIEALFLDSISRAGYGDLREGDVATRIVDALNGLCPTWCSLAHTPRANEEHVYGSIHFEAGEDIGVRLLTQAGEGMSGVGLEISKANDLAKPPMAAYALTWGPDGLEDIRPARRHEFPEIEAGKALNLTEEITEYLLMVGSATGSQVAGAIGRSRQKVASTLYNVPLFVVARKEGKQVFYGVKAGSHGDTSNGDTSVTRETDSRAL